MGPAPSVLVIHQTKTPVVFDWRCGGGLSDRVDFSDGVSQFTKVIADSIVILDILPSLKEGDSYCH